MSMSRKDFERLAEELSNVPRFDNEDPRDGEHAGSAFMYDVIMAVADACAAANPSFQRAKFYEAARLPGYRAKYGASAYESPVAV